MKFLKVKDYVGDTVLINLDKVLYFDKSPKQKPGESLTRFFYSEEHYADIQATLEQIEQAIEWLNDKPTAFAVIDNP